MADPPKSILFVIPTGCQFILVGERKAISIPSRILCEIITDQTVEGREIVSQFSQSGMVGTKR